MARAQKKSRYVGVSLVDGRWSARLIHQGRIIQFGRFSGEREAAIARDRVVLYLGLDRPLNLPRTSTRQGPASPEHIRQIAKDRSRRELPFYQSSYRGVSPYDGAHNTWLAMIVIAGRVVRIARFSTEREAAIAYDRVALHLHGAAAWRNFPGMALVPASVKQIRAELAAARKTATSSRYRGVCLVTSHRLERPWMAALQSGLPGGADYRRGNRWSSASGFLGLWATEREAAEAHDRAALYYLGAAAVLNFPRRARHLAPASASQLVAETRRKYKETTSSRFHGVYRQKRRSKWVAAISVGQERQYLGGFDDEEDAAHAYDRAAILLHGKAARLNFHPDTGEELHGMRIDRKDSTRRGARNPAPKRAPRRRR